MSRGPRKKPSRRRPGLVSANSGDAGLDAFLGWLNSGEVPPSLDRFVSDWIRVYELVGKPEAAELVRFLDHAVGFGVLVSFETFRAGAPLPEALLRFAATVRRPRDLIQLWRGANVGFAASVRAVSEGQDPKGTRGALKSLGEHDDAEVSLLARMTLAGIPPWHAPSVASRQARSGRHWVDGWLAMQASHPPVWLRVADPQRLPVIRGELANEGLQTKRTEGAAIAVEGNTPVMRTRTWRDGRVEIQDYASQRVSELIPIKPGEFIWDACAGMGGKSLHLWSRLGGRDGRGAVHASDAAPARLAELRKRLARANAHNVRVWPWDAGRTPPLPDEVAPRGGFDHVLVDAPCSGSGTWRRRPDARLRSQPSALHRFAVQQRDLLDAASRAVRPGGTVTFATCSAWVEENEAVIETFLQQRPAWREEKRTLVGCPDVDADTLFVCVLRRSG